MIEFDECSNYRGPLQAKEEGGKFFWRVDCDFEETEWNEIPAELWAALKKYHDDTAEQRNPGPEDGENDEGPNVGGEARLAAHQPSHTTTATPQGVASTDQLGGRFRSEKD